MTGTPLTTAAKKFDFAGAGVCSNAGDTLVDARSTKSTKDAGESAALPVDSGRFVDTVAIARTTGLDPPRLPPVPGRRPHALFCVYLD